MSDPNDSTKSEDCELTGDKLMSFITADDPAEAFLKMLEKSNPALAQEIRDEEMHSEGKAE